MANPCKLNAFGIGFRQSRILARIGFELVRRQFAGTKRRRFTWPKSKLPSQYIQEAVRSVRIKMLILFASHVESNSFEGCTRPGTGLGKTIPRLNIRGR